MTSSKSGASDTISSWQHSDNHIHQSVVNYSFEPELMKLYRDWVSALSGTPTSEETSGQSYIVSLSSCDNSSPSNYIKQSKPLPLDKWDQRLAVSIWRFKINWLWTQNTPRKSRLSQDRYSIMSVSAGGTFSSIQDFTIVLWWSG